MTLPSWDGPEFRISSGVFAKYDPSVVALGGGGFAVMWTGFLPAADDADAGSTPMVQLYGADRQSIGAPFAAPADLSGTLTSPVMTSTADGGFAVAWLRTPAGFGQSVDRIAVARFDEDGARIGGDVTVATPAPQVPTYIVGLAGLEGGEVAVVYSETGTSQTFATVLDPSGAKLIDRKQLSDVQLAGNSDNDVFAVGGGGFGFVETRLVPPVVSPFPRDVILRVFDADGEVAFATPLIENDTRSFGRVAAAELSDGRFAVAAFAQESGSGGPVPIVALVSAAGSVMSVTSHPALPANAVLDDLAPDAAGGFALLFSTFDASGQPWQEIDGWRFDASGARVAGTFEVNRTETGYQSRADGVYLPDGDLMVAWDDSQRVGFSQEIYGQALDPSGSTAGAAPTDIVLTGAPVTAGVAGAAIGVLSAVDPDAGDAFVFELAGGNAFRFVLSGATLSYSNFGVPSDIEAFNRVTVRVIDSYFNTFEEVVEIPFEVGVPPTPGPSPTATPSPSPAPAALRWSGTQGADRKAGAGLDDVLRGRDGADRLEGRDGDDRLFGDGGRDLLWGGKGDDGLIGGAGDDRLWGGGGRDDLKGGPGADRLWGGGANDRLWGANGNDQLRGDGGADRLWGGNGADRLWGGAGNDGLEGRQGADRLFGGDGRDRLDGGVGKDLLRGGGGDDRLFGGAGKDALRGESGRDLLVGGKGNDLLIGGAGRDVFQFGRADGNDRIADFRVNVDHLKFASGGGFGDLTLRQRGDDLLVIHRGTKVLLEDVERNEFDAGDVLFG